MYGSTQLPLHCLAGVDRAGCELTAYLRLVPRSASAWGCISSTLYVFMTWRFIDVKDNFTIPLIHMVSSRRKMVLFEAHYEVQKAKQSLYTRSSARYSFIVFFIQPLSILLLMPCLFLGEGVLQSCEAARRIAKDFSCQKYLRGIVPQLTNCCAT